MDALISTTPFGRRPYTLAQVMAETSARERPPGASVNKWEVFRAICAAREQIGLNERALAVLDALLSFHPEAVLSGERLVVFPSNMQLSLRAHGMAASTLRRHLAALVERGIVLRRDSPNGKRYARKTRDGAIACAFGFDLSPLVARAAEFGRLAQEALARAQAWRLARERLTLIRRDLAKMIALAQGQGAAWTIDRDGPRSWDEASAAYRTLLAAIPRNADFDVLASAGDTLDELRALVASALQSHAKTALASANESHSERHKQNSESDSLIEFETPTEQPRSTVPDLSATLTACPDIADYARNSITHWPDFLDAARMAGAALRISPTAWTEARRTLGEREAAVAVAAILQRGPAIVSPGGYLRALTAKAKLGSFHVGPMVAALMRARVAPGYRAC